MAKTLLSALLTVVATLSFVQCSSPTKERPAQTLSVSVEPRTGKDRNAVFTLKARPAAQIRELRLMVNAELDGRNGCYIYFLNELKSLALVNDSGEGSKVLPLGNPGRIENSQCVIVGGKSGVESEGGELKLTLAIEFLPAFAGKKQVFGYAEDGTGAKTGITKQGEWEVL